MPDVKCHGWKMVDVDLADHVFTHDPVKDRQELDTEVDKVRTSRVSVVLLKELLGVDNQRGFTQ